MSHVPHELLQEFPDHADTIAALKARDRHFAHLAAQYHDINREVHRAETDVAPTDDFALTEMRKWRALLKDEIYVALTRETA